MAEQDTSRLLADSADAFHALLRFETHLREYLLSVLARSPRWWKQFVPPETRTAAQDRRSRDRSSTFAPQLHYHQIYYCYLEDLKQIVHAAREVLFADRPFKEADLRSRFEELLALRNRVAHGRLLLPAECERVKVLSRELSDLIGIPDTLDSVTCEDPRAVRLHAVEYVDTALRDLRSALAPPVPLPLVVLSESPSVKERLDKKQYSQLEEGIAWLDGASRDSKLPGYRIRLRRELEKREASGLVTALQDIVRSLAEELP